MAEYHLLWTGGWDSTFRLLQLLLILKKKVHTYYIVRPFSQKLVHEIRTISNIRETVLKRYPHTQELFLPTVYFNVNEIKENEKITAQFNRSFADKISNQYEFLSRFTAHFNLDDLELSIENSERPGTFRPLLTENVEAFDKNGYESYRFIDQPSIADFELFKNFSLPIFRLYKTDMKAIAQENDFLDIMNTTWFCDYPTSKGDACGECIPCNIAVDAGLGYRVSTIGHIRYWKHQVIWKIYQKNKLFRKYYDKRRAKKIKRGSYLFY
jgi:hypothetical protein